MKVYVVSSGGNRACACLISYLGHDMTPRSDNLMLEGLCSITIFILEKE